MLMVERIWLIICGIGVVVFGGCSTGHESSPFFSLWYVCLGQHQKAVLEGLEKWRRSQMKKGLTLSWEVKLNLQELQEAKAIPTWKRPSNSRRKKLKKKLLAQQVNGV